MGAPSASSSTPKNAIHDRRRRERRGLRSSTRYRARLPLVETRLLSRTESASAALAGGGSTMST